MAGELLSRIGEQFLGVFLAPQSTLSIVALAGTFLVAASFILLKRGQDKPVRLALFLRAMFPRRIWKSRSGRADIGWALYGVSISGLCIGWLLVSSQWYAGKVSDAADGIALLHLGPALAVPLATVLAFLAYEFAYWLDHFLMHRIPALWMLHRVHHSADHLSLLTNFRVHPVESVLYYNLLALIVGTMQGLAPVLFGPAAAPAQIGGLNVLVMLFAIGVTHLQHSHFWVWYGPKWGRILLGPAHHQLHHSSDPTHHDCNFGSSLAIFDHVFGTFIMPAPQRQSIVFGIGEQDFDPHSLSAMTVRPVADAAAEIAKPLRTPARVRSEA